MPRIRHTIRRRKKLIVVSFALILLADIVGTYAMTPLWLGEARIMVMPGPFHGLAPFDPVGRQITDREPSVSTLDVVEMLGSREAAVRLVEHFGLHEKKGPGGLRGVLQAIGAGIVGAPGAIIGIITPGKPAELSPVDEAVKTLLDDLEDIRSETDTNIVNVGVWADSPQLANSLANALAESVIDADSAASRQEAERSYLFAVQELERADVRLDAARVALKDFREGEDFSDPQQDFAATMSRMEQARTNLDRTRSELAAANARLDETRVQLTEQQETVVAAQVVATNPVVEQLRSELVRLELALAGQLQHKREAHPDVERLRAQIEQNEKRLRSEIERIVSTETVGINPVHQQLLLQSLTLDAQRQGLEASEQAQVEAIADARHDLDVLAQKSTEFDRLNNDVSAAAQVAGELRVAAQQLDALRHTHVGLAGTRIRVIERSTIPDEEHKHSPSTLINLAAGIIAGAVLSLALAFFLEYWREDSEEESLQQ
ncbi:MAG: hypothetical protein JSV79_00920 [Armatimonadota bacterium]|nr:MAG: hypothetical protein JSV79_00920 [Armatimonadota bacterium]